MNKFVCGQNVERFRRMLESETDRAKREVIAGLLADEETKLAREVKHERAGSIGSSSTNT